jgi:hypothetical protein
MIPGRMPADAHEWTVLIIGFVVSFIVALGGGMVHELGPPARLHPVRHLPDHSRHRGAGVGDERGKGFNFGNYPISAILAIPTTAPLMIHVINREIYVYWI